MVIDREKFLDHLNTLMQAVQGSQSGTTGASDLSLLQRIEGDVRSGDFDPDLEAPKVEDKPTPPENAPSDTSSQDKKE